MRMFVLKILLITFSMQFVYNFALACGANTRTWQADAATTAWNNNNNWIPRNRPNNANENALIISDWFNPAWPANNYTLGCLEIQSGTMTATNNQILTISGDYFRNLNPGSLILGGANTWEVVMQGAADQTFENVDEIPRLRINNANTVRLTQGFTIRDRFLVDAGTGFVVIEGNLETQQTGAFTIQSGVDITLATGVSWTLNGNLIIDGTLNLEPGSQLIMANGTSITINAGGTIDVNGAAGSAVTIMAEDSSSSFSFTVNGILDAEYLVLDNMDATGVAMNASVTRFDNVNINSIPSSGAGMTIGASASLTAGMDNVGFFDDGTAGPFTNVNAAAYSGSDVDFANWSGIGDTANENDPSDSINWGTEATPVLQIQNVSGAGIPPATIAKGSASTQFATFAFSMSGTAASATNVTSLTLTLNGSNINSDVSDISVFNDNNGNCSFDGGTDTLIGSYTPAGSPGTVTVSMSGEINVIDTTQDCLHVFMSTAVAATTDNTIGISINSTDDITNDQGYALSDTSGPPVAPGTASITGTAVARWNGGFGTNMFTAGNWTPNGVPGTATDCEIGNGYSVPIMSGAFNCLNTRFQNSGTINWNNTANIFNVYGAWTVENGFTYNNTNNAIVNIRGAGDQSVTLDNTTFPNDVTINSGGIVTFEDSGVISGNLTLTAGTVEIANGATLQVTGNVSVNAGTTFDIEPGGTLVLGNGSSLTVISGGTLEMVGTGAQSASVRAVNDASSISVTVNNGATIRAQHYTMRNMSTTGLTINATATIDGTNFLQNGTFTYPATAGSHHLRLFQEIPGDVLDGMSFDSDGSPAGGVVSVFTNTGATADVLSMTNYSGNQTGSGFTNDTNYTVSWDSETNELKLTQESTAPASANQGDVVDMGTFGFEQLNAGSFNNTDLTFIRITLTGTGSSSDVDSVTLYYDSACSGSGGTNLGTQTFSGSPARAEFSGLSGVTVESDAVNPPLRCINVEYNINSLATNGATVGAEISSSIHVTNSEGFEFNSSFAPAVNLGTTSIIGTTTQWTGAVDTDWFTPGNWSSGVPTDLLNCIINDQANDPTIGGGTATCKSMDIGNGTLTHSAGTLEIYGSLESTGTINSSAPVVIRDNGVTPTSQSINVSSTLNEIQFNKTAGGSVSIESDVNITNAMSIAGGQNFTLNITANDALILNGGLTLSGATINMAGASQLQIGGGQTLTVNGGTFRTSGTNDAYPQSLANKAHITNTGGASTWSFSASSGTVDLTGFYFDWLDTSGLNFSGSVSLSNLNGGQLRNLPSSASMRALQFNTTGSIPATASNFGWNWGPSNSVPSEATAYFLGFSSGCSSQTIDFDQWFGDFWPYTTASTTDKVSATSCTILIDKAKSPVAITQLTATPYNAKVVVEWTTGNEWDHQGFNVYRSLEREGNYSQVNSELIRNDLFSSTIHGTYAFIDEGVTNDTTYFYYLEDVSLLGDRTLHGPLEAMPQAALGDPPIISAGTIVGSNNEGGGSSTPNPVNENVELVDNVWVMAQTDSYLRLKIDVPAMSLSADPLNGSYNKLSIDGYQPMTEEGKPELLQKTILVPVNMNSNVASWSEYSRVNSAPVLTAVTPAPRHIVNGNSYEAQWFIDSSFYGVSQSLPSDPIVIENVIEISGHYYLPILISPLTYNPVSTQLDKIDQIVLDIYLEGTAPWDSVNSALDPWAREGGVKLGYSQEGMYRVSFDELEAAGVVAPLANKNFQDIHLKISAAELGYYSDSGDSTFDSGDSIYFYGPVIRSDEDPLTQVLIYFDDTNISNYGSLRDAAPAAGPNNSNSNFWTKKKYEENNIAVFNEPYTEETDHYVWSLIYGISGGVKSPLEVDVDLDHLDLNGDVAIQVWLKSRVANSINTLHNLEIYVNNLENPSDEKDFQAQDGNVITFRIPASDFVAGRNKIRLQASGDNLIPGEYDMIYIDRFNIYYSQDWFAVNDEALVLDRPVGEVYELDGFSTSNILFFDVSQPSELIQLNNVNIVATSNGHKMSWQLPSDLQGRRLWAGEANQLKSVSRYRLTERSGLANSINRADIVFIGQSEMLREAKALGNYRESQNYEVYYADLENVFNEFGNGVANNRAIKDFITATQAWQKVPDYYILLGDGSYDPKGFQNPASIYNFPVKFIKGSSFDYVSDHWYVADDNNLLPKATIGRIPAKNPLELKAYVSKVLSYEAGPSRPSDSAAIAFVTDKPTSLGEDFESPISDISSLSSEARLANPLSHFKRTELSDSDLNSAILESFNSASIIHYMGHGAEDMWAASTVFNNSHVTSLNNSKLPVVVAMNCLNAQFADPSFDSLAEVLVLKEQGGAIAFWGSSSLTPPSIQGIYQNSFYDNLTQQNENSIGAIVQLSKTQAGLVSPFEEILYSWSIIGDPLIQPQISLTNVQNNPTTPEQEVAPVSGSGGGGCSAFASHGRDKSKNYWDLIIGFFFEILIFQWLLQQFVFRRKRIKLD